MDFATILGMIVSFGLITTALAFGGDISIFFNPQGLLIVLGGSFGALLTNYPLGAVLKTGALIRKTLVVTLPSGKQVSEQFLEYSYLARREGILALEPIIKKTTDPYLRKGLQLTVDGLEPETIQQILNIEIDSTESRHETGLDLLNALASYAPALGLIGTVIGLVQMLRNISDPASIGPGMAVALITTFYGAILANLVCLPLCGKLRHRSKQELLLMDMQKAAILGIARGENPRVIKEILDGFQAPGERGDLAPAF